MTPELDPAPAEATRLLRRLKEGDAEAAEALLPLVYRELHGLARRLMADERDGHTLQTTALLNEAWVRLSQGADVDYEDRGHFLRIAARAMRRVLVDHARARVAKKRGEGRAQVEIEDDLLAAWEGDRTELLALDEALERLAGQDDELAEIVELRFFGGLTLEETGRATGKSVRQVHRGWSFARGWLRRELERGGATA